MYSDGNNHVERRKFPRVEFREPVLVRPTDAPQKNGCLSKDLSEGGLRLTFEHFEKPNTPVAVEFRLRPGEEMMFFEGRVAWVHQVPSSDRYQIGIEFLKKSEENQKNIRQHVESD